MSNNIKVSDVFKLPLVVNKPVTETRGGWPIVSASLVGKSISGQIATLTISKGQHSGASKYLDVDLAFKMAQIGAESINNHDRLVEENAKLREALQECVEALDGSYDVTEWPANGQSRCDIASSKAKLLLIGD